MTTAFPNRILLVHLFSNGDCLYATAIARQIKNDYPDCHLTWAIASFCKSIIDNNPYVDQVRVVENISKNNLKEFRKVKKQVLAEKKEGIWDHVYITQNMDENQAYYDGCIRSGIFRTYPQPITVDITPVLRLTEFEKKRVQEFASNNLLERFKYIILFEFAPQSGQLPITYDFAVSLAERLARNPQVAVILSSAQKVKHECNSIIDGSVLTLRETAGLTYFCTYLIGCSSGITWATTSDGAKFLPMIQLINANTSWINPVSRDFERNGLPINNIIDILTIEEDYIEKCVTSCFQSFDDARNKYSQQIPLSFKTSRRIVYNLLSQLQFKSIFKHIKVNTEVYGHNVQFYKQVFSAFIFFPFTLLRNLFIKNVFNKLKKSN